MSSSGLHNYSEFTYQFLVSTLSNHNISSNTYLLCPIVFIPAEEKRKKIYLKTRDVSSWECNTMLSVKMYTILEYGQYFLYLNNGGILGTALLAN